MPPPPHRPKPGQRGDKINGLAQTLSSQTHAQEETTTSCFNAAAAMQAENLNLEDIQQFHFLGLLMLCMQHIVTNTYHLSFYKPTLPKIQCKLDDAASTIISLILTLTTSAVHCHYTAWAKNSSF